MDRIVLRGLVFAAMLLVPAAQMTAQQPYSITDLGTLGGTGSGGIAINNDGQVAGNASIAGDATQHAFLYSDGHMTDLGTLGGDTSAAAINDAGEVTGYSIITPATQTAHAFLYRDGHMIDLGTLGGSNSYGTGINNAGEVIGSADRPHPDPLTNPFDAFIYSKGIKKDLGTLGGIGSIPNAINSAGQVTGFATTAGGVGHAFLYTKGHMIDIGAPLGGDFSYGVAINKAGQVAGNQMDGAPIGHAFLYSSGRITNISAIAGSDCYYCEAVVMNNAGQVAGFKFVFTTEGTHTFLYDNGKVTDLGSLGASGYKDPTSSPSAINAAGQITGNAVLPGSDFVYHPTLYLPGSPAVVDLNSLLPSGSGWTLTDARGINDNGQITGTGTIHGNAHAFLMTPPVLPIEQLSMALASLINRTSLHSETKERLVRMVDQLPERTASLTSEQKEEYVELTESFIDRIQSLQTRHRISIGQAEQLIAVAQDVINVLKA